MEKNNLRMVCEEKICNHQITRGHCLSVSRYGTITISRCETLLIAISLLVQ